MQADENPVKWNLPTVAEFVRSKTHKETWKICDRLIDVRFLFTLHLYQHQHVSQHHVILGEIAFATRAKSYSSRKFDCISKKWGLLLLLSFDLNDSMNFFSYYICIFVTVEPVRERIQFINKPQPVVCFKAREWKVETRDWHLEEEVGPSWS